jgi:hypothetical protein
MTAFPFDRPMGNLGPSVSIYAHNAGKRSIPATNQGPPIDYKT